MTSTELPERPTADSLRTVLGVGGLVAALIGALILLFPGKTGQLAMSIIAVMIALYAVIAGAIYLGSAIFSKAVSGWDRTANVLLGLLYLAAGVVVFVDLAFTAQLLASFLGLFIGVVWVFEGIFAMTARKGSAHRGWSIFYGIVSLIAGFVLISSPWLGAITLWWLLGISMLVLGVVQAVRAFSTKTG